MISSRTFVCLLLILGGAVFVRVWGLRWGVPTAARFTTLYVDEYTPVHVLSQMNPRRLQFNPHYFTDPTFFYYQLGAVYQAASWLHVFKVASDQTYYLSHPDDYAALYWLGRLWVTMYGLGLTLVIFFLGRRIGGTDMHGLLSALFYALTPLAALSCHVVDVGVPAAFWLGAAFLGLLVALDSGDRRWLIIGTICAGFSFSTKYTCAPIVLLVAYTAWRLGGVRWKLLCGALFLVCFFIGTPYALLDAGHFWAQFHGVAFHIAVGHKPPPMTPSYLLSFIWLYPISVGAVLTVLCVIGLVQKIRTLSNGAVLALLFLAPYSFLLATSTFHVNRYLNEPLAFLMPFAAVPLLTLWRSPSQLGQISAIVLGILALGRVPYTLAIDRSLAGETDPRDQASAWICANFPPHSVVGTELEPNFMTPGQLYMQFWKGQRYPAQFVQPPDYRVVVWNLEQKRWPDPSPAYWIQNDMFFSGLGLKVPEQIQDALEQRRLMEQGFHPVVSFQRDLHWGPFRYAMSPHAGQDWFIFFPTLTIYQKNS